MTRPIAAVLLAVLAGCGKTAAPPEGVYTMCRDVSGFSGETIELMDGKFRYWFYSDVATEDEPSYPLTGTYGISENTLTLDHPKISNPVRRFAVVNGVHVLWRKDGLEGWEKDERIHPYAVLIRVQGASGDQDRDHRPLLATIKSAKLLDRDRKEYEERYHDQPPEVRALLRARSVRPDPNMAIYKAEIGKARADPDPKLVAQLVSLLHRGSRHSIPAMMILQDLYDVTFLVQSPPPFLQDADRRKVALSVLIDALSHARDRNALETTIMTFLRASGIGTINLPVPETGLRIILESSSGNMGGRLASEGTTVDDVNWLKSMSKLIPACQKWMREQIGK